jgi:succinylarginine dihydrolase
LHKLDWDRVVFAQQAPATIDAGVFHNDVIAVGHRNVLLYHARAFHEPERALDDIRIAYGDGDLWLIELGDDQVTVAEAVGSYLFNSQLLTLADGTMAIVVPTECQENVRVKECLEGIVDQPNPLSQIVYVDVRESMKNGGGPACLRLRVVLTERELDGTNQGVLLTTDLYERLAAWIDRHYRDRLAVDDLVDPALLSECRTALDELTVLLNLGGSVYPFQRT